MAKDSQQSISNLRLKGYRLRFVDTGVSVRMQREALNMAVRENNMEEVVVGYTMLSFTYAKDYQVKAASDCADSAYFLATKVRGDNALAYGNLAVGYMKNVLKQPSEALSYLHIAYVYFTKLKNYSMLSKVCYTIAGSLKFAKGSDYYADLSLKYARLSGDMDDIVTARQFYAYLHFNILSASDSNFKVEDAVQYYKETMELIEKDPSAIHTKSSLLATCFNFAVVIYEHPYPGSDSLFLATLDKAVMYIEEYKLNVYYSNIVGLKGNYFAKKGDYDAAQKLYEDGIRYVKTFPKPDNNILATFYFSLKELAASQHDYISYYKFDTAFTHYNVLQNNDALNNSLVTADVRFQSSQKAAQIKSLEVKNKMQRINNWLVLGVASLLFLGLILMIRTYYFRKKYYQNNETLLLEQQKTIALKLQIQKQETLEMLLQKISVERKLLQSQMDPHFVFNALGNIKCFILQNDIKNADAYLSKFSKLMRQVLAHSKKDFITLEDEIETLKNYIDMQRLRLNYSFEYDISLDENIDTQIEIPPMLIQPFVENAIEHGLKPLDVSVKGCLKIHFKEGSTLKNIVCTICDNGIGVEYSKKMHQHTNSGHQSLATNITKERIENMKIQDLYANLDIHELKDGANNILGTEAIIHIPVKS